MGNLVDVCVCSTSLVHALRMCMLKELVNDAMRVVQDSPVHVLACVRFAVSQRGYKHSAASFRTVVSSSPSLH
jgi:hypothetical protein